LVVHSYALDRESVGKLQDIFREGNDIKTDGDVMRLLREKGDGFIQELMKLPGPVLAVVAGEFHNLVQDPAPLRARCAAPILGCKFSDSRSFLTYRQPHLSCDDPYLQGRPPRLFEKVFR
jgi:hypothetical protein